MRLSISIIPVLIGIASMATNVAAAAAGKHHL
jgi:hypothetical protein